MTLFARSSTRFGIVRPICCCFKINYELEIRGLLDGQISGSGSFQDLIDIVRRAAKEVIVVHSVEHQAAFIDKFLLKINSGQSVFAGKLDNPLSCGEKRATGAWHNSIDLLLPCGLKGALQTFGVGLRLDLLQF